MIIREHPVRIALAFLFILAFVSLKFVNRYGPLPAHDWNKRGLSRIKVPDPESFTFAVLGDNQSNKFVFEPILRDLSRNSEAAFVIALGDLVKNGKTEQYRHLLIQVERNCTIPFLAVVGNHDLKGGPDPFRKIFGPTYYAFRVGQSSFIVLDPPTESGLDRGERQWLEEELRNSQSSKNRFVFMHVPPFDPRGKASSKSLRVKHGEDLLDLFRRYKVTHLFAGDIHGYFSGVWKGVPYTITGGAGERLRGRDPEHFFYHYAKVQVTKSGVQVTANRVDRDHILLQVLSQMKDDKIELALLFGAGILIITSAFSRRRGHRG